jgi:hypothetical protein
MGLGLNRFLLFRFVRKVMADGAAGNSTQHRMMMRKVTGHGPNRRALETSRGPGRHGRCSKGNCGQERNNGASHWCSPV